MKLVILSPEGADPREPAVLAELFAAGLERYHVRKPGWTPAELEAWLGRLPPEWRPRLILHQHRALVASHGLGGFHWRDTAAAPPEPPAGRAFSSRSCHDPAALLAAFGRYDSVFFGPVFPSISKPGHGPRGDFGPGEISAMLSRRAPADRRTAVLGLGGVTPENAPRCVEMGFDGIAVLGAVWRADDPARAFSRLQTALHRHAA
jgi:thiamine-phosphate pyrophosphorylase